MGFTAKAGHEGRPVGSPLTYAQVTDAPECLANLAPDFTIRKVSRLFERVSISGFDAGVYVAGSNLRQQRAQSVGPFHWSYEIVRKDDSRVDTSGGMAGPERDS